MLSVFTVGHMAGNMQVYLGGAVQPLRAAAVTRARRSCPRTPCCGRRGSGTAREHGHPRGRRHGSDPAGRAPRDAPWRNRPAGHAAGRHGGGPAPPPRAARTAHGRAQADDGHSGRFTVAPRSTRSPGRFDADAPRRRPRDYARLGSPK
ncbi:hypothetical protein QJS66_16880 [Kocuria rhizophila]|nr:hypothetical protein QJS66_16880 [Kocuria rhizophila]